MLSCTGLLSSLLFRAGRLLLAARQLFRWALRFAGAMVLPRAQLAARVLAAESQLAILLNRPGGRRRHHRFPPAFRLLWVVLSKLMDGWQDCVHLMKPETVVRWHRTAVRLLWRRRSRPGRPPIPAEMQQLVRQLSRENSLWAPDRIRDVLLLLGYDAPSAETIRKYMVRPRKPRSPSTGWVTFLRNHLDCSWAIDAFTVTTLGFHVLSVFLVFDHARRKVLRFAVTPNPTVDWITQQLREAMPFGQQPRYLFRDNDQIYGQAVRAFLVGCGILEVRTAHRSPWQNPYIERFIGTLRRELLDHVIVVNQRHLERLLQKYLEEYYHPARPHRGLDGQTPVPSPCAGKGQLISVPVVGGLHHRYWRTAA